MKSSINDKLDEILCLRKFNTKSDFPGRGKPIYIYGAGNCGKEVANHLSNINMNVIAFLDANIAPGTIVNNLIVRHPDDAELSATVKNDCLVIIAIYNASGDVDNVCTTLKRLGFQNIITFPEFHSFYGVEFGPRFWLSSEDGLDINREKLAKASDSFHDKRSQDLYYATLSFRKTANYSFLPPPSIEHQYFDDTVCELAHPILFVDCGSFTGDTLLSLYKKYGKVESVIGFEPDLNNFKILVDAIRTNTLANEAILFPSGVWSETRFLQFSSGMGSSSTINMEGDNFIQCVSLDDVLVNYAPSFIKMDIEGAEIEALNGAKKLIHKYRPKLAISVYHTPEHLWEIPNLISSLDLGYKLYLRSYGFSALETILYAI